MRRVAVLGMMVASIVLTGCVGPYGGGDDIESERNSSRDYESTQAAEDYRDHLFDEAWDKRETQTAIAESGAGSGNYMNCEDFDTHREAQAFFEAEGGPDYDPHWLDDDNDGIACELLP